MLVHGQMTEVEKPPYHMSVCDYEYGTNNPLFKFRHQQFGSFFGNYQGSLENGVQSVQCHFCDCWDVQ